MSKVINRAECESIEFLAEQKIRPERIASIMGGARLQQSKE